MVGGEHSSHRRLIRIQLEHWSTLSGYAANCRKLGYHITMEDALLQMQTIEDLLWSYIPDTFLEEVYNLSRIGPADENNAVQA